MVIQVGGTKRLHPLKIIANYCHLQSGNLVLIRLITILSGISYLNNGLIYVLFTICRGRNGTYFTVMSYLGRVSAYVRTFAENLPPIL